MMITFVLVITPGNLWDGMGISSHFSSQCFVIITTAPQTFGVMSINPAFLSQVKKKKKGYVIFYDQML